MERMQTTDYRGLDGAGDDMGVCRGGVKGFGIGLR